MTRAKLIYGTLEERFWPKVDKSGDCWLWTAHKDRGYGRILIDGIPSYAHRASYELANGSIAEGMQVDHICRNPSCVRPDHLRLATPKQNSEHKDSRSTNSSGHRGVTWYKSRSKWVVQVRHNYKMHSGGYFADLEDAIAAATALRLSLFTHNDTDRTPIPSTPHPHDADLNTVHRTDLGKT